MDEEDIDRWFIQLPGKRKAQIHAWLAKQLEAGPLPNQLELFDKEVDDGQ